MPETEQIQALPIGDENWSETPPTFAAAPEDKPADQKPADQKTDFNPDEFVKTTFGFDSVEVAKTEIEKLKQPKSPEEIKFANDFSKNAFEYLKNGEEDKLFEHLSKKREVKNLSEIEVNEKTAADIVKFDMKQKHQGVLDAEQIEYQFKKLYNTPKEPVQADDELDEDFAQRKGEWNEAVSNVKMQLAIDAKLALPNIKKIQEELILPDIFKNDSPQPTQEDLQKAREGYLAALESESVNFSGFETAYENKEVGIPELKVPFGVDEKERKELSERLKEFDVDGFVFNRWFPEGKANIKQLMSDVYLLENRDKILQKIASESGNKAISTFIERKKNPSYQQGIPPAEISSKQDVEMDKLVAAMLEA